MEQNNEYTDIYQTEAYESNKQQEQINSTPDNATVQPSSATSSCFEWLQALITAVVIVVLLLTFVFRMVDVDGPSMLNTLHNQDRVILTNFMYTPKSGDIVVISHASHYDKPIIKRVIATEGQTLKIDYSKAQVIVDGVVLDEPYIKDPTTQEGDQKIPEVIPEGKVFVMGDNRAESLDSRYTRIGLINETDVIGKAQIVVFPFDRFGLLSDN